MKVRGRNSTALYFAFSVLHLYFGQSTILAAPATFEDFSSTISLNKFSDAEQSVELDTTNQNLIFTQKGSSNFNKGESNSLALVTQTIEMLQADLSVSEVSLGSPTTQQAFVRLGGYFYKTAAGNIWTTILLGDRGNGLEAWYEILELDTTLNTVATFQGTLESGLSLNTPYTSSLSYDGNDTFTFVFNGGSPVNVTGPTRLSLPDSLYKFVGTRIRFGINNSTPNDFEDSSPDAGFANTISATVDNVITSQSTPNVFDDFSSVDIDTTKWSSDEISNEIVNNELVMKAKAQGAARVTRYFTLRKKDYKNVGATITLLGSSSISTNSRIRGRILHYLGNDTYNEENGDTYNGREGDIFTLVGLSRHAGGFFTANIYTARENVSPAPETQVFGMGINLPQEITFDQPHVFLIERTGMVVNYKVDGIIYFTIDLSDTTTYPMLSGNLYPASDDVSTSFRARIENDPGQVHVKYDDIIAYNPEDKNIMTRAEIAKPLLQAIYGKAYIPPSASGNPYTDVDQNDFNADWIAKLKVDEITEGCAPTKYCPNMIVTKEQLAKLLLKTKHGSLYMPSSAMGDVFDDVPLGGFSASWIEELADQAISAGCSAENFCSQETASFATFEDMLDRSVP